MADNTTLNSMTGGDVIATDEIAGVKHQRIKVEYGADGSATDVSIVSPLPVAFLRDAATHSDTTSTPLGIDGVYTTPSFDTLSKGAFNTHFVFADQAGTCNYEESTDDTNWNTIKSTAVAINTLHKKHNIAVSRYWRVRYVNGGVAQTVFRLQAIGRVVGAPNNIKIDGDEDGNVIKGEFQHNTAGAGADALNTLPAIANAAAPTYSETNVVALSADLAGNLRTKLGAELPAGTQNIGDIDILSIAAGSNIIGNVRIDQTTPGTTNGVQITAAIPTGSNAIGKLAANTGVTIGAVEIAATQTLATVTSITNAVTVAQSTAPSLKNEPAGNVAHGGADSGNPIKIGGRADTTFQTAVTDGQRVEALFGVYGEQRVRIDQPNRWSYHENSSSALTDAQVQASPGAGLSVYITDIVFSTGAATACNIFLEEAAAMILGPYYLEAIAGRGIALSFNTPHKCTAATAVTVTTSAAIAHGLDIKGFIAP